MATRVMEIMNGELYAARAGETVGDVTASLPAFGITAAPVLDDSGRVRGVVSVRDLVAQQADRAITEIMTVPATTISGDATIQEAGHVLAMTGYHHVPVTDATGRAVGFVSALDVIRGLLGVAVTHPAAFPHLDAVSGVTWTDETELDADRIDVAPDGPGVLVLIRGASNRRDSIVWIEGPNNVRSSLLDLFRSRRPSSRCWPGSSIAGICASARRRRRTRFASRFWRIFAVRARTFSGAPALTLQRRIHMRNFIGFAAVAVLVGMAPAALAQRMFDPSAVETLKGTIVSINELPSARGMGAGIHAMVKTDKETISVHLGPAWFVKSQDVKLQKGDTVEVRGSRITYQGKPAVVAAEVKKGDATLKLRQPDGTPLWAGSRRR